MADPKPTLSYADPATIQTKRSRLAIISLVLSAYTAVVAIVLFGSGPVIFYGQDRFALTVYVSILLAFICSFAFAIVAKFNRSDPSLSSCALIAWGGTAIAVVGLLYHAVRNLPSN